MAVAASQTSLAKLEPILLLSKSATGGGAAQLISQATSANGCYVFSELLEQKGIADLANSKDHSASYRLLEIFSFGTLSDYLNSPTPLPKLNANQLIKLKQLTLVSLASKSSSLSYETLLKELDMKADVRELEDLIIDTIYAGILQGRLNQMSGNFQVMGVMGRDINGGVEIEEMVNRLREWSSSSSQALASLSNRIEEIQKAQKKISSDRRQHEAELARNLLQVQNKANGVDGEKKDSHKSSKKESASKDADMANFGGDGMDWEGDTGGSSRIAKKKASSSSAGTSQTRAKRSRGRDRD